MLFFFASFIASLGLLSLAIVLWRQWQRIDAARRSLDVYQARLEELIVLARRESHRLEEAIATATGRVQRSTLAAIEELGEPGALENGVLLEQRAAAIAGLPSGVAEDVFQGDQKSLAMARLVDQGHSVAEIARRLGLPLGEVELRASLRS